VAVLVVDDHTTFSDLLAMALAGMPDLECVGTASSMAEASTMAEQLRPDVVVMDVQLGGDDGIEATRALTGRFPELRVVVLTAHADRALMRRAADAGACCLLPKNGSLPELLDALRNARRGGFIVDPTLLRSLVASPEPTRDRLPPLTRREREVLRLLSQGNDPQSIARELGISVHTCRGYVKTLLVKLGAHSQLEAVSVAIRNGLVDVSDRR
jgi:DNA-binding NarL/FixJ family response regulator